MNINPKFVDLSHYDQLNDIAAVEAAGYRGIVNKASEGPGMVDVTFAQRRAVVLGAGMQYGAYHFLRPGDMAQQAAHFLNVVGDPSGLLLAADWEVNTVSVEAMKEFLGNVHDKVGRWPVLYSYASMLIDMLGRTRTDAVLAQVRLWLAAYNSNPDWPKQIWPNYWAWQFTGDGNGPGPKQVPGIVLPGSKGIDINSYDGSDAQLVSEWTGGTAAAAPHPVPVSAVPVVKPKPTKMATAAPDPAGWWVNFLNQFRA